MSDNHEGSPIKGLFRNNEDASDGSESQAPQNKTAVPDTAEIHMAEEEMPQPRGKLRTFFDKIVEILKQPDDMDLMLDDDDEVFEDIFAEKPTPPKSQDTAEQSGKQPKQPEKPKPAPERKPEEKPKQPRKVPEEKTPAPEQEKQKPVPAAAEKSPVIQQEEKPETEAVLYRAEKAAEQKPEPQPKPKAQTRQEEVKTEISLDEILRVSASVTDRPGFRMTAGEIFGRDPEGMKPDEAAASQPAEEELQSIPPEEMQEDTEGVLFVRKAEPIRPFQPKQPEPVPAAVEKTELSHDSAEIPKPAPRNDELSHSEPSKPAAAAVQNNELSHDSAEVPRPAPRNDELSHSEPSKPAAAAVQNNELSHDSAEVPKAAPRNDELSHSEPLKTTASGGKTGEAVRPLVTEQKSAGQAVQSSVPENVAQGFSEEKPEPLVYKSGDGAKMVIMVGKFTSTVKTEYLKIRRLRSFAPPMPKDTAIERSGAEESRIDTAAPKEKPEVVKKEKKPQVQKKKEKFRISDIFNSQDYEITDEDYDSELKNKPQIDDYSGPEDKESIKSDLGENMRKVFARTVVLCVTCAAAVINALLCQLMPELYNYVLRNGWLVFGIISFILLAVSVFTARYQIVNGLMPLRHFKGNSDTAVAAASVAGVIQSVTALFMPEIYVNGTYHLYVPLVILALMLHSFGNLLIVKRTADNFAFLSSPEAAYAGKIYTNSINAEKFASGLPSRHPLIAYIKESAFMTNFLRLSYEADPVESIARFIAPYTVAISLALGLGYGLITRDFIGGVSSFAIFSVITTPMCSMIAINMPLKDLCASTLADGAMVAGYETVRQFGDTNILMLDAAQLYPKGNIILSGIRSFNENKLKSAIMAGAAITFAVDGPMAHIFDTIIQSRTTLPEVTTVSYDDGLGLRGWIGGQRILIGNRKLLEKHNITPPNIRIEEKYRKMGSEVSYITMGGELVAMFIMTYKTDREIAHSLRLLEDNGVSFVIRSIDCNLTPEFIAEKFSLLPRCIKVLPTGLGTIANEEMTKKEKNSRAYLITNGKLKAFASAVAGCIKMKSTVNIAKIIQYLAVGLGLVLVLFISFISGFAKLGILEMLIYNVFWIAAMIIVSAIVKKLM